AVLSNDLRLGHQIQGEQMAEGDQVVDEEARGGKDQSCAAGQHRDQHQLALDGKILEVHSGYLASAVDCGMIFASASNLELIFRSDCLAASRLTSKRTLLSSTIRLMMQPRRANPGVS